MKLLVTGATGFVGSVLVPELVARYGAAAVTVFALPGEPPPPSWAGLGVEIQRGDVLDAESVHRAVAGRSHVVHLAGLISYWRRDAERLMRVNRDGVRHVVDACLRAGVRRLVHISSVGAVGFHRDGEPADETTPFNWPPAFHYMSSKHAGQLVVEEAARTRGLDAVILNPASVMGPGDYNAATPHNQLYRAAAAGRLLGTFTGGLAVVDVRDLAGVVVTALERGRRGERYLVVGSNQRYADVIRQIGEASGRRADPLPIPAPLVAAAGALLEGASWLTNRRPLLTLAYGRLSGWRAYYSGEKSRQELGAAYRPFATTVRDSWAFFSSTLRRGG